MTLDDFETAQDLRAAMAIIPLAALAIGLGIGAYRQSCTSQPTEDTTRIRNQASYGILENSKNFVAVNGIRYGVNDFNGLNVNQKGTQLIEQYDSEGRFRAVYVKVE